jgi:uncharacterized membrane protein YhhN
MDPIVKNELARSIGVFFISLVFFCILFITGILGLPGYAPFLMAFLTTGVIFLILIWFRKNHPSIKTPTHFNYRAKLGGLLSLLIVFAIYMSISLLYPISRILWPVLLLVSVIVLMAISFKEGKSYRVNLPRWLFFYIVVSALIVIHDFVMGNATQLNIIYIVILGIISIVIVLWYTRISGNTDERNTGE